jgi:hypothetical protein
MNSTQKIIAVSFSSILIAGCASAFMDMKEGAEKVSIASPDQISRCEPKGSVTASVLSKVMFVNRSIEGVEDNLVQIAKNSAVDLGANTIVKGESKKIGERTFSLYQCK